MESLPKEIHHLILKFCDKKDYNHILLINKYWSPIVLSNYSFKKYFFTVSNHRHLSCVELVHSWNGRKLFVPLKFYFNRQTDLAIPLHTYCHINTYISIYHKI
jgi:hypothetical protein